MEWELSLFGHEVVHNGKDALLHLACVLSTQDDHLPLLEVNRHRRDIGDALDVLVGVELSGVEDVVVGSVMEVGLQLLLGRPDEHIVHEQSVVGTGAHHSDLDAVVGVPPCIAVQNVKLS